MSYCVSVGTSKKPNPKYQQYYDAENDYLVPYNSGDTGDKNGNDSESNKSTESVEEVDDYYCQMEPNETEEDSTDGSNKSLNTQPSKDTSRNSEGSNDESSDCMIIDMNNDANEEHGDGVSNKVVSDRK